MPGAKTTPTEPRNKATTRKENTVPQYWAGQMRIAEMEMGQKEPHSQQY